MKQAQAMLGYNLKKAQDELGNVEVEGQKQRRPRQVVMTCKHEVRRVTIDPACWPMTGHARRPGGRRVQRRRAP